MLAHNQYHEITRAERVVTRKEKPSRATIKWIEIKEEIWGLVELVREGGVLGRQVASVADINAVVQFTT